MKKEFELDKPMYLEVIEYIKLKHDNQFRKFSMCPYYIHPIRVACLVMKYKESHKIDELVISALLHDVLEDTDTTEQEIELKYGWQVLSLCQELSSDSVSQKAKGKTEYLSEKLTFMSSWALVIKLCDRLDNVMDFAYAEQKFIDKYALETVSIMDRIKINRKLSSTHLKLIDAIEKQVSLYWRQND